MVMAIAFWVPCEMFICKCASRCSATLLNPDTSSFSSDRVGDFDSPADGGVLCLAFAPPIGFAREAVCRLCTVMSILALFLAPLGWTSWGMLPMSWRKAMTPRFLLLDAVARVFVLKRSGCGGRVDCWLRLASTRIYAFHCLIQIILHACTCVGQKSLCSHHRKSITSRYNVLHDAEQSASSVSYEMACLFLSHTCHIGAAEGMSRSVLYCGYQPPNLRA